MKSDKGRDLVIMDRADYLERMKEITEGDNFKKLNKTPLPGMKNKLNGD